MTTTGVPSREVALADNTIGPEEIAAVVAVLEGRWLSADRVTRAFEAEFAGAVGADDAVHVSSGTAALHLAVLALRLKPGDEVIIPSLSFVASAAVCALHGIVPVFADVRSPDDLTLDPDDVRRLVSERTRTSPSTATTPPACGGTPASGNGSPSPRRSRRACCRYRCMRG